MIVAPKYDENTKHVSQEVLDHYQGVVEIQMLCKDLMASWRNCQKVLHLLPDTKMFVLHLPFPRHALTYWCLPKMHWEICQLFFELEQYAEHHKVYPYVLFHVSTDPRLFEHFEMDQLLKSVQGNIGVLIENSFLDLSHKVLEVPAATIFLREYGSYSGCIDTCHLQASTNFSGIRPTFTRYDCSRVNYFHFSKVLNGDGWCDMRTHGRRHESYEDVKVDIAYIKSLGFNIHDAVLVAEITEQDYAARPDMHQELEWLWRYQREEK